MAMTLRNTLGNGLRHVRTALEGLRGRRYTRRIRVAARGTAGTGIGSKPYSFAVSHLTASRSGIR
jgi:hypothetical protein